MLLEGVLHARSYRGIDALRSMQNAWSGAERSACAQQRAAHAVHADAVIPSVTVVSSPVMRTPARPRAHGEPWRCLSSAQQKRMFSGIIASLAARVVLHANAKFASERQEIPARPGISCREGLRIARRD